MKQELNMQYLLMIYSNEAEYAKLDPATSKKMTEEFEAFTKDIVQSGNFKAGDVVAVVDDVITTGGSTLKAIDQIEAEGGKVAFALVLLDREEGGRANIESRGIKVFPAFTRSQLLD